MLKMNQTFALNALAAALLAVYGPSFAADDAELKELSKPTSVVSIGAGVLSGDDRQQLGVVGGLHDTGGYFLLDADINRRDDATGIWQTLYATNLGMDSRELRAEIQQQGNQGVAFEYRQSKREVPYTVNTGVTGIGTANQSVPLLCTAPGVPAGCNYTLGTGSNVQLGTERQKYGLEYFKYVLPNFKIKIVASTEDKDGTRIGRVGGTSNPEFATIPIEWHVHKLDATFDYVMDKLQLSGGYNGSWFINDNDLATLSKKTAGVPTLYYISQPLDSVAQQFFLNGGYAFTPSTRGSFKLSYTHATQDEHIPTADIPGLAAAASGGYPAAPTSLGGEINTTLVELGLTSRPMPKLSLVGNLRYHKVDDQTPQVNVVNTIGNAGTGFVRTLVGTTPMSYETLTGKLEAMYSLMGGYKLIGGIDYTTQDRSIPYGSDVAGGAVTPANGDAQPDGLDDQRYVPMRSKLDETTYRLQLRRSMSETINGAVALLHSTRTGSVYDEATHSEPGEGIHSTAIDPINIADRTRDKVRLSLDWTPAQELNFQFNYENANDEYSGHTYGLRDGKAWLFSADASYDLSQAWKITAWYSHDENEANQLGWRQGSATNAELDMQSRLKDTGDSIGLGVKGLINPKLKIGADLQWTRTKSEYSQMLTALTISPTTGLPVATAGTAGYIAGTGGALPDITSTTTRIKLFADYALKKNTDLRFDLIYERWNTNDWTWQYADGTSYTFGDGTQVLTNAKQASTFFSARYNYKF